MNTIEKIKKIFQGEPGEPMGYLPLKDVKLMQKRFSSSDEWDLYRMAAQYVELFELFKPYLLKGSDKIIVQCNCENCKNIENNGG